MCASRRRTKWILGNVQNNYHNVTDYVNRRVESSRPSDQQQWRPDCQKFDDDLAQKEGDGQLSEDAVNCQCLRMICQYSFKYWGVLSCIHRRTVMQSLNCTRSGTSSQSYQYVTYTTASVASSWSHWLSKGIQPKLLSSVVNKSHVRNTMMMVVGAGSACEGCHVLHGETDGA